MKNYADESEEQDELFEHHRIISQTSQSYLNDLIQYNHVLKQRNSLLKQFADRDFFDAALLQQYTDQLIEIGQRIHQVKKNFTQAFRPLVQKHYALLSEESEQVDLQYESDFAQDIDALFK
jgi:DNA replication and repair protein RecF